MKNIFYISLIICTIFISCKKENPEIEDLKNVTINLSTPVENQIYVHGDTIKIQGNINGSLDIHGYMVRLVNLSTGMNVLNQEYHLHQKDFSITEYWKNTVSDTTQMKIIVDAAIDHEGNLKTFERLITCYPL